MTVEAGFTDQAQEAKFRSALKQRFNTAKISMISSANRLQKRVNKMKLDKQKKQAIFKLMFDAAGLLSSNAVSSTGGQDEEFSTGSQGFGGQDVEGSDEPFGTESAGG